VVAHVYTDADPDPGSDGVLTLDDHPIRFRIGFSDGFSIACVLRELPDTTHFAVDTVNTATAVVAIGTTSSSPVGWSDDFACLTDITDFAYVAHLTRTAHFGYIGHVNSKESHEDEGQSQDKGRLDDFACCDYVGESTQNGISAGDSYCCCCRRLVRSEYRLCLVIFHLLHLHRCLHLGPNLDLRFRSRSGLQSWSESGFESGP
jgi:hypothetical protein